ncbi:MAG: hypothetical protein JWQ57_3481 [Mucilaginibacter sp.]|nr:hypothetical protein [Mucilaginibacter sp.]
MNKKARVIAMYLPQFHPIPENDEWWGKGFTEWTNVGKAKPLFKGHQQPRVPADLGYYDLRLPEIREAQAKMAHDAGIEGFMYWHYWFGNGKTVLERVFKEVLESGKPDFPFCFGWANHSWTTKTWSPNGQYRSSTMILEQLYPGENDYKDHFYYLSKAFKDKRYITVDNKPVFLIYEPHDFKDVKTFIDVWQKLAKENGLEGIHFIGQTERNADWKKMMDDGFDAASRTGIKDATDQIKGKRLNALLTPIRNRFKYTPLNKYDYAQIVDHLTDPEVDKLENVYPVVIPNFDHSPRSGRKGLIFSNSTPVLFKKLLQKTIQLIQHKSSDHKVIILRSWNEWAEGNYVEPDLLNGNGYLDALREEILQ